MHSRQFLSLTNTRFYTCSFSLFGSQLANMTINGAIWYQGTLNAPSLACLLATAFIDLAGLLPSVTLTCCAAACCALLCCGVLCCHVGENNGQNPGNAALKQGYACLLPQMIKSWRREFSTRGASAPDFPFGVVNLHSWCGEEEASCNPGRYTSSTYTI